MSSSNSNINEPSMLPTAINVLIIVGIIFLVLFSLLIVFYLYFRIKKQGGCRRVCTNCCRDKKSIKNKV